MDKLYEASREFYNYLSLRIFVYLKRTYSYVFHMFSAIHVLSLFFPLFFVFSMFLLRKTNILFL